LVAFAVTQAVPFQPTAFVAAGPPVMLDERKAPVISVQMNVNSGIPNRIGSARRVATPAASCDTRGQRMSGNSFGQNFRITTAGESHGPGNVVIIDGCPPGIPLTVEDLAKDLARRRPGQSHIVTQRQEADEAEILSGVFEGKTTGTSIAILVRNQDQKSRDYDDIKNKYRPGHADYTFDAKYGFRDYRGGGR